MGWFISLISITLTMIGFGGGIGLGIVAGYFMLIYFEPDDVKDPLVTNLSKLDFKGLQELLPEIPLWVKSPDYEKVDWLNKFVEEIWPYMNKAICKIIRETAEPYIAEYKPKYNLDAVDFTSLTLGTLPPVFMGVRTLETTENDMIFELAAKFAGNPDIKVAVKAHGMTAVAQLVDAQVFASARVTLKSLVPVFPCFTDISVSLLEKPHVDFGLKVLNTDVMAIPLLDKKVQAMISTIVASMYLWPNKLDVPIINVESISSNQAQGVLTVNVLRCKQLRNKDLLGLSDPYVRLQMGDTISKTKVIMNNLNPEWKETFSMIVNNPETDVLEIAVYDWDQVGGHDKLGVQRIPLQTLEPDSLETKTLPLLKNFDVDDRANQKNRGQITLELEYKPFDGNEGEDDGESFRLPSDDTKVSMLDASMPRTGTVSFDPAPVTINPVTSATPAGGGGLLLVKVHAAEDVEGKSHTNPYVRIIFRGDKRRTKVVKRNRDPRFEAEFEFVVDDAPLQDRLLVEVRSKGTGIIHYRERGPHVRALNQESLGHVEIDLADVVKNKRINEKYQLLGSKNGKVHLELQWRSTTGASALKRSLTRSGPLQRGQIEHSGPLQWGQIEHSGLLTQGKPTP